jgi:hypothetical protein
VVIEPIRLHFAYTPQDWEHVYRLYRRRSRRMLRDRLRALGFLLIAGVQFLVCNLPLLQYGIVRGVEDFIAPLLWLLLAIIEWFDLMAVVVRWVNQWRGRNKPSTLYDFEFDESGARFSSSTVDAKLAWTEFKTVYEDEYSLLLILKQDKGHYWAIPKRYFAAPRDLDEFQRMLQAQIPPP